MDRQADTAEAVAVEKLLFTDAKGPKLPPKPEANGLAWLRLGGGNAPAIVAVATAKLNTINDPVVSADTIITDVPRVLGFGAGAPIAGTAGQGGDWSSLTVVSPSIAAHGLQPPSAPCNGPAISIDLSLASAGQLTFRALVDTHGEHHNDEAVKALIDVLADPVSPFNSTETFTGLSYALVEDGTGIHLRAAG
jgi:hypothetical protein